MLYVSCIVALCILTVTNGHPYPTESKNDNDTRIIGGTVVAKRGKYPFLVSLQSVAFDESGTPFPAYHFCGGSILNERWVVTAAHCINSATFFVVAGKNNLKDDDDQYVQKVLVQRAFPFPNYNPHGSSNDIALIYLSKDLSFNQYIQPIELSPSSEPVPTQGACMMIGWGLINDTGVLTSTDNLREVPGVLKPRTSCLLPQRRVWDTQVCTGDYGRTACKGDSGSPLIVDSPTGPKQIGVASYVSTDNYQICTGDVVYTYVGAFMDNYILPMMRLHKYIEQQEQTYNKGLESAPFLVSVHHFLDVFTYTAQKICSGTIIEKQWILTSATCIERSPRNAGDGFYIVSGVPNPYTTVDTFNKRIINVHEVFIHPQYDGKTFVHDVALLQLVEPLVLGNKVHQLNLPADARYTPVGKLSVAGHVLKGTTSGHVLTQNDMTSFQVELDDVAECQKRHADRTDANTFCVKPSKPDLCPLDIGGPIYDETQTIIGVSAMRNRPCGLTPEIYGKLTDEIQFVVDTMVQNASP